MKKWQSTLSLCVASLFCLNANAVVMAAQPLVGESLNAFIVGLQTSPLPPNLSMFKTAQFYKQSYFRIKQTSGNQYYQAYYVDANNDHENEYVLTEINEQLKNQSEVIEVFKIENNLLVPVGFNSFVANSLGIQSPLTPCKNWYCGLANPFLFYQGGEWYMRFTNQNNNNQMCQYLWTDSKFVNSPSTPGCIGASSSNSSIASPAMTNAQQ